MSVPIAGKNAVTGSAVVQNYRESDILSNSNAGVKSPKNNGLFAPTAGTVGAFSSLSMETSERADFRYPGKKAYLYCAHRIGGIVPPLLAIADVFRRSSPTEPQKYYSLAADGLGSVLLGPV